MCLETSTPWPKMNLALPKVERALELHESTTQLLNVLLVFCVALKGPEESALWHLHTQGVALTECSNRLFEVSRHESNASDMIRSDFEFKNATSNICSNMWLSGVSWMICGSSVRVALKDFVCGKPAFEGSSGKWKLWATSLNWLTFFKLACKTLKFYICKTNKNGVCRF